jgi:hypothetical protein
MTHYRGVDMASITATVNTTPATITEARTQWLYALKVAESAERIYNKSIEKGLPDKAAR